MSSEQQTPGVTKRSKTYYVLVCSACGKEVEVSKDSKATTCYACDSKAAYDRAVSNLAFLVGAEVIEVKPWSQGHLTDCWHLSSIRAKTSEGRILEFESGGWDEHYITWDDYEEDIV